MSAQPFNFGEGQRRDGESRKTRQARHECGDEARTQLWSRQLQQAEKRNHIVG